MSTIFVDNIKGRGETGNKITVPTGQKIVGTDTGSIVAPGHVLQVKQAVISNTQSSTTGNTWLALSGFNVSITPTSSSSKFLLQLHAVVGMAYWQLSFRFKRGSTAVGVGDVDSTRQPSSVTYNSYDYGSSSPTGGGLQYGIRPMSMTYLDSPATTSAITYGIDWKGYSTSYTIYLNRSYNNSDSTSYDDRPISTFTVMEIAQ